MSPLIGRENAKELDADAAVWAIRLEEHGDDPAVQAALQAWLMANPRRSGALLRAQAALCFLDRGRALGGSGSFDRSSEWGRFLPSRRKLLVGGSAVAGIAAALGGVAIWLPRERRSVLPASQQYQTEIGEMLRVPLADGTIVTLNTDSMIEVSLLADIRAVSLRKGEVLFEVAKDAHRPFVVTTGGVRIRAVGTAFSVRRRAKGADVLVTEGVVESWVGDAKRRPQRLQAGHRAAFEENGEQRLWPAGAKDVDRLLAWREGQIVLYGQTLGEAAEEFNRYNTRKIYVADTGLAAKKLIGRFRTDQPEAFATAAVSMLNARVVVDGSVISIVRVTPKEKSI